MTAHGKSAELRKITLNPPTIIKQADVAFTKDHVALNRRTRRRMMSIMGLHRGKKVTLDSPRALYIGKSPEQKALEKADRLLARRLARTAARAIKKGNVSG